MSEPIGVRLKRLRTQKGLTQRQLSGPGATYAYISRIEAGDRMPSMKVLREIAPKLDVSVEFLETGELTPLEYALDKAGMRLSELEPGEVEELRLAMDEAAYKAAVRVARRIRNGWDQ